MSDRAGQLQAAAEFVAAIARLGGDASEAAQVMASFLDIADELRALRTENKDLQRRLDELHEWLRPTNDFRPQV